MDEGIKHKDYWGGDGSRITVKDIWQSNYEQFRHETDRLWQNAVFAWGFVNVLFVGYSATLKNFIQKENHKFEYNLVALFIALLGLFISAVWIAISKASRSVQKSNGDKIKKIESDSRFSFCPREYVLGGTTNRFPGIDTSLKTLKNGAFSLSRINIFLAQTIWCIWFTLFLFHSIYGIAIEENNRIQIFAVLFCLLSY